MNRYVGRNTQEDSLNGLVLVVIIFSLAVLVFVLAPALMGY